MRMQPCITPSALIITAEPRSIIQLASTAPLCLNARSERPSGHADHSADCWSICGPNFAVEQRAKRGTSAARKERVAAALRSAKALVEAMTEAEQEESWRAATLPNRWVITAILVLAAALTLYTGWKEFSDRKAAS